MKMIRVFVLTALILAMVPGTVLAGGAAMEAIGSRAAAVAMEDLAVTKGDENLLVMTDAVCAMFGNRTTERCISGVAAATGCSIGDGNLLVPQRSKFSPLWFFFYRKDTGKAVFLQVNAEAAAKTPGEIRVLPADQVFEVAAVERIDAEYLVKNQTAWKEILGKKAFAGNEFSLVGIANMWADPRTPYDFLRAASFHNHLCPGVSSGYLISKYVEQELPIESPTQSYRVIACPVWCKDDLFPMIWDATPGKKGLFAMDLNPTERDALKERLGTDVAGIYIRWDAAANRGDGLVVGYNWTRSSEVSGTAGWKGDPALAKIVDDLGLIGLQDNPGEVVTTVREFVCTNQSEFAALTYAGSNPLEVLGVVG